MTPLETSNVPGHMLNMGMIGISGTIAGMPLEWDAGHHHQYAAGRVFVADDYGLSGLELGSGAGGVQGCCADADWLGLVLGNAAVE